MINFPARRWLLAIASIVMAVLLFAALQARIAAPPAAPKQAAATSPSPVFESRARLPQHQAVAGLDDEQKDRFILGRSFFTIPWVAAPSATTARDGLGPLFNANSCVACHSDVRHKQAATAQGSINRTVVFKLAQPQRHAHRNPRNVSSADPRYGLQIAINGISGVPFEAQTRVRWHHHTETLADGSKIELRRPTAQLSQLQYGPLGAQTRVSLRMAPVLVGLGLLSQVSEADILAQADPHDADNNGIRGQPQWVINPLSGARELGRFGYKAAQSSVLMQTADAAVNDMGLTNPLFPNEQCTDFQAACHQAPRSRRSPQGQLDLPMPRLQAIAFYLENLRAPANTDANAHPRGRHLFARLGCAECHLPQMRTATGVLFEPYTDLLLHDMGADLADERPEFEAGANQWRTAALWGVGAKQRAGIALLHDGRARTLAEAIMWHGGEAAVTRTKFNQLNRNDREALHLFLEAL